MYFQKNECSRWIYGCCKFKDMNIKLWIFLMSNKNNKMDNLTKAEPIMTLRTNTGTWLGICDWKCFNSLPYKPFFTLGSTTINWTCKNCEVMPWRFILLFLPPENSKHIHFHQRSLSNCILRQFLHKSKNSRILQ